jgi:acyl-CoA synthetase (AMP-forming)/AMP-acid ligase II
MFNTCGIRMRPAGYGQVSPVTMLYERWLTIVGEHRNEFALRDVPAGRRWTFRELAAAAESGSNRPGPAAFPQGAGAEFILTVLRAWRAGQVVFPLEPDQLPPNGPWPVAPVAHVKCTSATTGRSRLVAFTAEQLAADAANLAGTMGLRHDWPNLGVISLAHSYGFSSLVSPLLLHGIPLILGVSALPEPVRLAAQGEAALTLPGVPALWRAWREANAIPHSVRLAISAGAPLPIDLERAVFETTGVKIHNFYGSSESGGIAYDRTTTPRQEPGLAGTPVDNVSLAVADDGCLEVRGLNIAQGYWPEPSPTLGNGLFHTSDIAHVQDGQVFLVGRATDVIHVAGRKVAPEVIEHALLRHPHVREALVLGIPIEGGREEVIAAVLHCARSLAEGELRQFLLTRLPAWQVPRHWHMAGGSIADARGKTPRAQWRGVFR